ncbi:MAG TPA: methyl-accepting chemotaxis protein [Noviherbaspirillum sp.]
MNLFNNLRIGSRLALCFGTLLLLILGLSAFSLLRLQAVSETMREENRIRSEKLEPLYVAREALDQTGIAARNAFIYTNDDDARRELDMLDKQRTIYLEALGKLQRAMGGDQDFAKVSGGLEAMAKELDRPRKYREAKDMTGYGAFLVNECSPLRRKIVADMEAVIQSMEKRLNAATENANDAVSQSSMMIIVVSALAAVVSVVLALMVTRSIVKPIRSAVTYARSVATGDLTQHVENSSKDETGELMRSLQEMNDSLLTIVTDVRTGTQTISTATVEISAGSLDLSQRTEEQASSLEETASSMEELTSTVKQNAQNAKQANTLALSASDVAVRGGNVVSQVVDTMNDINASSTKIVDIISVIDGIAFQTNILALNAAVEAARAGEQGRGFAVVAAEVRSLAQRSASAAREIKSLIDDSVHKVKAGTSLVDQAGATMQEIVDSVKRVSDIISEIALASDEQSAGIAQVNQALSQMDQVTQQNAALVEQTAAAAGTMQQQAESLSGRVSVFKIGQSQDRQSLQLSQAVIPRVRSAAPAHAALRLR